MKAIFKSQFFFILSLFLFFILSACKKPGQTEKEVLPVSPTELTVTLVSNTQATLNWVDKSTNEAGFKVERKAGNGTFGVIATTSSDITTINDAGLTPNTTYTYRVYSFNNTGKSLSYTNEVTITTYTLPTLTTTAISDITGINAVSGGNITNDGGSPVTSRGIVWGTSPAPTVALSTKSADGFGEGQFTSKLDGLTKSTKYYVRAYATSAAGTAYGNEVSFTTTTVDLTTGLVAYYPFNGNANDESGNGNNGLVNGATLTSDRLGKENSAYSFNGTNNYIHINKLFFDIGWVNYSICFWSNLPQIPNPNNGYSSQVFLNTSPHTGIAFDANWGNSGKYSLFLGNGGNNWAFFHNVPSISNSIASIWKHFVVTRNGNTVSLYIDGKLDQTWTGNLNVTSRFCSMFLGAADPSATSEYLRGVLDEFRFYNRSLSQEEIQFISKN